MWNGVVCVHLFNYFVDVEVAYMIWLANLQPNIYKT